MVVPLQKKLQNSTKTIRRTIYKGKDYQTVIHHLMIIKTTKLMMIKSIYHLAAINMLTQLRSKKILKHIQN